MVTAIDMKHNSYYRSFVDATLLASNKVKTDKQNLSRIYAFFCCVCSPLQCSFASEGFHLQSLSRRIFSFILPVTHPVLHYFPVQQYTCFPVFSLSPKPLSPESHLFIYVFVYTFDHQCLAIMICV